MPLTRVAEARTVFRRNGVSFLMKDAKNEVPCFITNNDLLSLAPNLGIDDIAVIFSAHRSAIERAASDGYDRSSRHNYEIVMITASDLISGRQ